MNNENFQTIITENKYEQPFNPNQNYSCQYYDEGEFIIKNRNGDDFLNVFSLNIRSLSKNGGELMRFLGTLKSEFHVIIPTEIGSRNLTVAEKIFPNYTFFHNIPQRNNWGGVGIYTQLFIKWGTFRWNQYCTWMRLYEVWGRKFVCWIHVQWCNVRRWGYL